MKIDVLTIFPVFFQQVFDFGIIRRAKLAGIVEINIHDLREYTTDKHRMVDDRPFGGGDGMVLKCEPIFVAIENLVGMSEQTMYPLGTRVVLLSPQGQPFKQADAQRFADDAQHVVLICGRYEGVDERVNERLVTDEISIGDYVLTNGAIAAAVITDAIVRLLPDVLGDAQSAPDDSFASGLIEGPQYTRPVEFRGWRVPDILLSGNHGAIAAWRHEQALENTRRLRPDLLAP